MKMTPTVMRVGIVAMGLACAAFAKHFELSEFSFNDFLLMFGAFAAGSQSTKRIGDIG